MPTTYKLNTLVGEIITNLKTIPAVVGPPAVPANTSLFTTNVDRFNPVVQVIPKEKRPAAFVLRGADVKEDSDGEVEFHVTTFGVLVLPEQDSEDVDKRLVELEGEAYKRILNGTYSIIPVRSIEWLSTTPSVAHKGIPLGSSLIRFKFKWAHLLGAPTT